MGLDIYLTAKRSFYDRPYYKEEVRKKCKKIREIIPEIWKSGNLNKIEIAFEAGYWRKANHIHSWFVENVQDGVDDCGKYWVSREKLEGLLALCKEVKEKSKMKKDMVSEGWMNSPETGIINVKSEGEIIKNTQIAEKLLPTQSGFFFGSTGYDQYYIRMIERTIEIIEKCLNLPKGWMFYYQSSW